MDCIDCCDTSNFEGARMIGILFAVGVGLAIFLAILGVYSLPQPEVLGWRRRKRNNKTMRIVGPWLTFLKPIIPKTGFIQLRKSITQEVVWAGDWLGLVVDEFFALSVVSSFIGGVLGMILTDNVVAIIFFAFVGLLFPKIRVSGLASARRKKIVRSLPGAIDLMQLSVSGGSDLLTAIRRLISVEKDSPVVQEFERVLFDLSLGVGRVGAIKGMATRCNSQMVDEFCYSLIQGEEMGTPLGTVLNIQAEVLREKRTVQAEEWAAKAGVLLLFPVMLMVGAILGILVGPLALDIISGSSVM